MRAIRLLVLLALVAPVAEAHGVEHVAVQAATITLSLDRTDGSGDGEYTALLQPMPDPLFANTTSQGFRLQVREKEGFLLPEYDARLVLATPDASWRATIDFSPTGSGGYQAATATIPQPGKLNARIIVTAAHEEFADAVFDVFVDHPFRILVADSPEVYANESVAITFETVDRDGERRELLGSLHIAVEHWDPSHKTLISRREVLAHPAGMGLWRIDHVFGDVGHYYVTFASPDAGFNYGDAPPFHVDVDAARAPDPQTSGVPSLGLVGALVALGLVALLRRR